MSEDRMRLAVTAVRQRGMSIRKAAEQFRVSKSTLGDHLTARWGGKTSIGPQRQVTEEEETALVNYLIYMNRHGFPVSRAIARCYVRQIIKQSGRQTMFNMDKGPSDEWFRKLIKRHPQLVERKPQQQDRNRAAMSTNAVMVQFFTLLKTVLEDNGILDKPDRIYNCDETGWTGKESCKTKVIGEKTSSFKRLKMTTTDHVTGHLCVSADGRFLPTMVIFKGSLPHRTFKDGIPDSWLFASSESGYMDTSLFCEWFRKVFVPNCGRGRPVILLMDNHDSHVSLECVEEAMKNEILLLGLPAHTTHLLQPLDVKIFGPLKSRFATTAANLGFTSSMTIGKAKFPLVLRYAIDQVRPASVRAAFEVTGICPYRPDAVSKEDLTPAHHQEATDNQQETADTCSSCGNVINNPLVAQGLIPASLATVLVPPPTKPSDMRRRRLVTEARVFTGAEMLQFLKDKDEKTLREKEAKERRKEAAAEKKAMREKEQEERMMRKEERVKLRMEKQRAKEEKRRERETKAAEKKRGSLASEVYVCGVCGERGREFDERVGIEWVGCDDDMCMRWYHFECLDDREKEYVRESMTEENEWFCKLCKPWFYEEE